MNFFQLTTRHCLLDVRIKKKSRDFRKVLSTPHGNVNRSLKADK